MSRMLINHDCAVQRTRRRFVGDVESPTVGSDAEGTTMQNERRRATRKSTDILVNKFIDGMPHMARLVEISPTGCLLERMLEPELGRDLYPLELALPASLGGTRLWLWARPVWSENDRMAYRFVGLDPVDRATLARLANATA